MEEIPRKGDKEGDRGRYAGRLPEVELESAACNYFSLPHTVGKQGGSPQPTLPQEGLIVLRRGLRPIHDASLLLREGLAFEIFM